MIQGFDIGSFIRSNRRRIVISIFLFWLVFALLIFIEDALALRIGMRHADPIDNLQYGIRWVLWTLLTPVIIYLAIKFPIEKRHLIKGISIHFLFALLITTLEFSIEIPIIQFASNKIAGIIPPVSDYAAVFLLKLNIYLLLYFLVVGATYLVMYIESNHQSLLLAKEAAMKNQQLQMQLTDAKLSMLKMQLDPHFLFNAHHSIMSLMLDHENEKAIAMLTKLSELLRLSLEDGQQTIPLEKEISMLKLYLDIQQIRFQERLQILFSIDPASLKRKVPSFILQPLVENAIKHGAAVSSLAGNITIQSKVEDHQLILKVENDGAVIDFKNFREGIGVANTRERLRQLYNGQSKFELKNLENGRVGASITLPLS